MRLPRKFYKGSYWHIFNRGVAKEDIFRGREDFTFYLYKIKEVLKKYPLGVHAYNLLNNHLHYLIEQTSEIPPSKFISSLHTSFGGFINRKYSRVGHLFQDRFGAREIKNDEHLLKASFYVNLNKILERLQHFKGDKVSTKELQKLLEEAEKDPWSSYPVYLGLRDDGITQTKVILSLLSDDMKKAQQEYRGLAKQFLISGFFLKSRGLSFEDPE